MSRDRIAGITCYIFGGTSLLGLIYFALLPRAVALDFRGQMALSRFAFWMAACAAVVLFCGFFRQDKRIRMLTTIFGIAMSLLWLLISAGHLPVA
jgi:hypothetical protein